MVIKSRRKEWARHMASIKSIIYYYYDQMKESAMGEAFSKDNFSKCCNGDQRKEGEMTEAFSKDNFL
jgi:hypothetical protein